MPHPSILSQDIVYVKHLYFITQPDKLRKQIYNSF